MYPPGRYMEPQGTETTEAAAAEPPVEPAVSENPEEKGTQQTHPSLATVLATANILDLIDNDDVALGALRLANMTPAERGAWLDRQNALADYKKRRRIRGNSVLQPPTTDKPEPAPKRRARKAAKSEAVAAATTEASPTARARSRTPRAAKGKPKAKAKAKRKNPKRTDDAQTDAQTEYADLRTLGFAAPNFGAVALPSQSPSEPAKFADLRSFGFGVSDSVSSGTAIDAVSAKTDVPPITDVATAAPATAIRSPPLLGGSDADSSPSPETPSAAATDESDAQPEDDQPVEAQPAAIVSADAEQQNPEPTQPVDDTAVEMQPATTEQLPDPEPTQHEEEPDTETQPAATEQLPEPEPIVTIHDEEDPVAETQPATIVIASDELPTPENEEKPTPDEILNDSDDHLPTLEPDYDDDETVSENVDSMKVNADCDTQLRADMDDLAADDLAAEGHGSEMSGWSDDPMVH